MIGNKREMHGCEDYFLRAYIADKTISGKTIVTPENAIFFHRRAVLTYVYAPPHVRYTKKHIHMHACESACDD